MKKFIYNISFLLSILIISIFVLKKISDIKDSKPNSIMIINNSGITIENFSCKHVDHSISMELFANESSFEFSFISNGESHLELAWFINDSVIHKNEWMKKDPPVLKWVSGVSSASTDPTSDIYKITHKFIDSYGTIANINPLHTSSDIRNPIIQKGIPTVGFGPICGNLTMSNESNEWVDLEDYFRTLCITTEIVATFCNEIKD